MIFHNTKLINLWETAVSFFLFVLLVVSFFLAERCRQPLATLRECLHLSARGYSFIALRFGTYSRGVKTMRFPCAVSGKRVFQRGGTSLLCLKGKQIRRICSPNSAYLQCNYGVFASQIRRICFTVRTQVENALLSDAGYMCSDGEAMRGTRQSFQFRETGGAKRKKRPCRFFFSFLFPNFASVYGRTFGRKNAAAHAR